MTDREVTEAAAQEVARRMMEDVRMKARREFTETLRDRIKYHIEHPSPADVRAMGADHPAYERGQRDVLGLIQSFLDNPVAWRTP